jgi:hypothetical protein
LENLLALDTAPSISWEKSVELQVKAQSIECEINDDEALSSVFVRWGVQGSYFDVNSEESFNRIYCELNDQANGGIFNTITYHYVQGTLEFSVSLPETFVTGQNITSVVIDLSGVEFDESLLMKCLDHIFERTSYAEQLTE